MAGPARQSEITVGDIRIAYLPDGHARIAPTAFFPASTPEGWKPHGKWLDEEGRLVATIGGFLIRTGGRNVLVDVGFGAKEVEFPGYGPFVGGRLLESLKQAGLEPADIDTIVYTHLHLDHVGWTSRAAGETRALTFPNARHLMMAAEWQHWHGTDQPVGPSPREVQQPLENRVEWLSDGQTVAPGVNVLASPGHTPGHVSVVVSSGAQRAIILGDVVHCPVQLDEADWSCVFDVDPKLARRTRERMWAELEDPSTVGAGGHFSDFVFGRLMLAEGKRQWTVTAPVPGR